MEINNTKDKLLLIQDEEFWKNFDLSIVMPFYKKMKEFRKVFPRNQKFIERNGIEVIIVLDTPDESDELLEFIKNYPFVNWRVIMNEKPHEWRNPAKPLNVGLRHAIKKYVMVCSPESEMLTDVIYILRKTFEDYPDYPHYAIGRVCFVDNENVTEETFNSFHNIPFGSIMVARKHLQQINGYDETLSKWGGDDNNLRSRLDMAGIKELFINDALMVHRDIDNYAGKDRRSKPFETTPNDVMRHYFFPETAIANDDNWGKDFDKVIFDWRNKTYSSELLQRYLSEKYIKWEYNPDAVNNEYPILLLLQTRNESRRIIDFLNCVSQIFDGIILLDDESDDETYNLATSDKIVLKVVKSHIFFNDLENRNMLLDLASFFNFTLGVFLDADELLDDKYNSLADYLNDNADAYLLPLVNLWNEENTYNAEYPNSIAGICLRYKMFRNIGHTQIYSNQGRLHFHQVPTLRHSKIADKILIKHYGMLEKVQRQQKYDFYKNEDTQKSQETYEHIIKDNAYCQPLESITPELLANLYNYIINKKYENPDC